MASPSDGNHPQPEPRHPAAAASGERELLPMQHGTEALPVPETEQDQTAPPAPPNHLHDLLTGSAGQTWSRLLVRDHLNPTSRHALARTCQAALDMMLGAADKATLTLDCFQGVPITLDQLETARRDMEIRGRQRTALRLTHDGLPVASDILRALGEAATWLDELEVCCVGRDAVVPTAALETWAGLCPNLRVFRTPGPVQAMPSPELFPKLEVLAIHNPDLGNNQALEHACRSIGQFTPQLTELSIWVSCPLAMYPLLLPSRGGGGGTACLHTLSLYTVLNVTLLGIILQGAPALEELTVMKVRLNSDRHAQPEVHAQTQTKWRLLQCEEVHMSSFARLPRMAAGAQLALVGKEGVTLFCDDIVGIEEAVSARLKAVQLVVSGGPLINGHLNEEEEEEGCVTRVRLWLSADVKQADDEPAVLGLALSALRSCPIVERAKPAIEFGGWTMTADNMLRLQELPRWAELHVTMVVWLPDDLLHGTLLRLLPDSFSTVTFFAFKGLSSDHVGRVCLGAPVDRSSEAPLHIQLFGRYKEGLVEAILSSMQQVCVPNVFVTVGDEVEMR